MNRERGINAESVVELLLSIAIGALFFLPWFGFGGGTVSGAGIFPLMRDLMEDTTHGWAAYTFLLLYLIPLLSLISVICFIALRPRAVRRNFVSLCDTVIILLIALVLIGALEISTSDYGRALLDMISGMGVAYFIMLALSVAGLIFAAAAKAIRKPPLSVSGPDAAA